MPNTHLTLSSLFTDIANAIRSKTGGSAQIVADDFPTEIANIPSGGIDPSDATATASDIVAPKTAYISTGKTTGTMPDNGSVDITLDTTNTSYTVAGGKHSGSGTVKVVPQTKSVSPTTNAQTVSADSGKVLESVSVSAIQTQTKSVTPNTSAQTVTPDSGKYLTSVNVGAIPNQRSGKQGDITPSSSAQTVYIPSGWYDGSAYFSVGASSGIQVTMPDYYNTTRIVTFSLTAKGSTFDLKDYVENGHFYWLYLPRTDAVTKLYFTSGAVGIVSRNSYYPPQILLSNTDIIKNDTGIAIFVADKNNAIITSNYNGALSNCYLCSLNSNT